MIIKRAFLFLPYLNKSKPRITVGVGDFILAFSSRLFRIPSLMFYDDYEFSINYQLSRFFGNRLYVPEALPEGKKIVCYPSFKELAYLHPNVYSPRESVITQMSLEKEKYVFVREVAGISMNYSNLKEQGLLEAIKYLHAKNIKVVLSLEDKSHRKIYKPYCIILEEPLEDIYSIMHYALFSLSSGDSMARESALLGVPCIYTGGREMLVNKPFIDWGGVFKIEEGKMVKAKIEKLLSGECKQQWKNKINGIIKERLINPTDLIVEVVETFKR